MIKLSFAFPREKWKEQVEGFISGALGEYAKAEVAENNKYTTYLKHWRKEVYRLVEIELPLFLMSSKTKTNFDRCKAVHEVISSIQQEREYTQWLEGAAKILASNYFKHTKRKTDFRLPNIAVSEAAFWVQIEHAINDVLDCDAGPS